METFYAATRWVFLCVLLMGCGQVAAENKSQPNDLDVIDWELVKERMALLSQLGYHPFLLPLVMENRDMLGLTKDQVNAFKEWRSKYRVPLIHTMNQIVSARVAFQRIALNPETTEEVLLAKQAEIFKLHEKVLKYQLSCRRNILDTFTEEQWDNFRFLLTEHGYVLD